MCFFSGWTCYNGSAHERFESLLIMCLNAIGWLFLLLHLFFALICLSEGVAWCDEAVFDGANFPSVNISEPLQNSCTRTIGTCTDNLIPVNLDLGVYAICCCLETDLHDLCVLSSWQNVNGCIKPGSIIEVNLIFGSKPLFLPKLY